MKFPWHRYEELPLTRRNTLQIFITDMCNLKCTGCFVRKVTGESLPPHMPIDEFKSVIDQASSKFWQINLLGGEPLLHPHLPELIQICKEANLNVTVYTNGYFVDTCGKDSLKDAKLRVSLYSYDGEYKSAKSLPKHDHKIDANFMVSSSSTLDDMIAASYQMEAFNCKVFFISSIRELDNPNQEFFEDTELTMPVLQYKRLVHRFLNKYDGRMDIHISKRGVFESTVSLPSNTCNFSNYFIGGRVIHCPYDVVNLKFSDISPSEHMKRKRNCQHNNTCLMSKVIYRPKREQQ